MPIFFISDQNFLPDAVPAVLRIQVFVGCIANPIPKPIQIESEEAFSKYFFCESYLSCGILDQRTAGG